MPDEKEKLIDEVAECNYNDLWHTTIAICQGIALVDIMFKVMSRIFAKIKCKK